MVHKTRNHRSELLSVALRPIPSATRFAVTRAVCMATGFFGCAPGGMVHRWKDIGGASLRMTFFVSSALGFGAAGHHGGRCFRGARG